MHNDKKDKDRKWRWESDDIQPRDKKKQKREHKGRRVDANQLIRAGRFNADELYEE